MQYREICLPQYSNPKPTRRRNSEAKSRRDFPSPVRTPLQRANSRWHAEFWPRKGIVDNRTQFRSHGGQTTDQRQPLSKPPTRRNENQWIIYPPPHPPDLGETQTGNRSERGKPVGGQPDKPENPPPPPTPSLITDPPTEATTTNHQPLPLSQKNQIWRPLGRKRPGRLRDQTVPSSPPSTHHGKAPTGERQAKRDRGKREKAAGGREGLGGGEGAENEKGRRRPPPKP
ncbi:hypothetical protein RHMOL_Rhmol09G0266600 [Rhododendron molle]|uniref:Uncharacterized protein n=1 Tax=Rhododendron molle TaxID=49168 RepID=A0ACC0MJF0_RHOML|nr:hypothetical protein RHMOL_Rhmol09G0266600 [Rhododendron molle]